MPTAKHRKNHNEKVNKFKTKQKQNMSEKNTVAQFPPHRNIPVWDKNAKIEILGYEWEVIYNTVAQMQLLGQATNAVMSRNIVNGVISMDFEKLNPETLEYVEMTDDEKKPLLEEFHKTIEAIKDRNNSIPLVPKNEAVENGTTAPEVAVKEKKTAKKSKEAKVVSLG